MTDRIFVQDVRFIAALAGYAPLETDYSKWRADRGMAKACPPVRRESQASGSNFESYRATKLQT